MAPEGLLQLSGATLCACVTWRRPSALHCHLDHAVPFLFKQLVALCDPAQGVGVGDERFGIDLAFCDETQRFFTIAAVHAAGLKGEVFAVHCLLYTSPSPRD